MGESKSPGLSPKRELRPIRTTTAKATITRPTAAAARKASGRS